MTRTLAADASCRMRSHPSHMLPRVSLCPGAAAHPRPVGPAQARSAALIHSGPGCRGLVGLCQYIGFTCIRSVAYRNTIRLFI